MNFNTYFESVKPIVAKTRREFYVKLWDWEDWEQEARLILFQLLESRPELCYDLQKRLTFFKVKFRNYVIDVVRKQQSLKRTFDRLQYEEIGEVSHLVPASSLLNDDLVVWRDRLADFRKILNPEELLAFDKLLMGEPFNGRRKLIRRLRDFLEEGD